MCRLGVRAYLDVPLGSVGSTLSKAMLLRLPESVNKQTNKQASLRTRGGVVIGVDAIAQRGAAPLHAAKRDATEKMTSREGSRGRMRADLRQAHILHALRECAYPL